MADCLCHCYLTFDEKRRSAGRPPQEKQMERPLDRHNHNSAASAQDRNGGRPARQRIALVASATPSRGESTLLSVADIVALLGRRKSAWWVRHHFAPEAKIKLGRSPFWYADEAESWIRAQRASR